IFKGFKDNQVPAEYVRMLEDFRYANLFVADSGFDIRPYRSALESFSQPYFCFLNSFSRPLDRNWLAKLNGYVRLPGVGLVGASGSWESMYSNALSQGEPDRRVSFAARLWSPFRRVSCKLFFTPFPNYHVRTNAFIISRGLALECWPRFIPTKRTAYLFEA